MLREAGAAEAERSLPKLGGQMAFPWLTATLAGAAGVVGRKDVPHEFCPFPALYFARDPSASSPISWGHTGGHVPTTPTAFSVFALCVSHIPPMSFCGGNLAYFYCHYTSHGAPVAATSTRNKKIPSTGDPSHPKITCALIRNIFKVSIHRLVTKSPFLYPNEAACAVGRPHPSRCVKHPSREHRPL